MSLDDDNDREARAAAFKLLGHKSALAYEGLHEKPTMFNTDFAFGELREGHDGGRTLTGVLPSDELLREYAKATVASAPGRDCIRPMVRQSEYDKHFSDCAWGDEERQPWSAAFQINSGYVKADAARNAGWPSAGALALLRWGDSGEYISGRCYHTEVRRHVIEPLEQEPGSLRLTLREQASGLWLLFAEVVGIEAAAAE